MCSVPNVVSEEDRLFIVFNESSLHQVELEATSPDDAVATYRQRYGTRGYARIRTSDVAVFLGHRPGRLHQVHHTDETSHPTTSC